MLTTAIYTSCQTLPAPPAPFPYSTNPLLNSTLPFSNGALTGFRGMCLMQSLCPPTDKICASILYPNFVKHFAKKRKIQASEVAAKGSHNISCQLDIPLHFRSQRGCGFSCESSIKPGFCLGSVAASRCASVCLSGHALSAFIGRGRCHAPDCASKTASSIHF